MAETERLKDFYTEWLAAHDGGKILDAGPTGPVSLDERACGEFTLPVHNLNGQS